MLGKVRYCLWFWRTTRYNICIVRFIYHTNDLSICVRDRKLYNIKENTAEINEKHFPSIRCCCRSLVVSLFMPVPRCTSRKVYYIVIIYVFQTDIAFETFFNIIQKSASLFISISNKMCVILNCLCGIKRSLINIPSSSVLCSTSKRVYNRFFIICL